MPPKAFKQIVVLKGHRTVVTDGNRVYVNHTGDSSLSKAGTGDVLSGMIASLIGQEMDRFDAACAGGSSPRSQRRNRGEDFWNAICSGARCDRRDAAGDHRI